MSMEITRLASVSWLRRPDRQFLVMRAALLALRSQSPAPSGNATQRLPELDWPQALFADETADCVA